MKQLVLITSQGPFDGKKRKSLSRGRDSNKKASGLEDIVSKYSQLKNNRVLLIFRSEKKNLVFSAAKTAAVSFSSSFSTAF